LVCLLYSDSFPVSFFMLRICRCVVADPKALNSSSATTVRSVVSFSPTNRSNGKSQATSPTSSRSLSLSLSLSFSLSLVLLVSVLWPVSYILVCVCTLFQFVCTGYAVAVVSGCTHQRVVSGCTHQRPVGNRRTPRLHATILQRRPLLLLVLLVIDCPGRKRRLTG